MLLARAARSTDRLHRLRDLTTSDPTVRRSGGRQFHLGANRRPSVGAPCLYVARVIKFVCAFKCSHLNRRRRRRRCCCVYSENRFDVEVLAESSAPDGDDEIGTSALATGAALIKSDRIDAIRFERRRTERPVSN